MAGACGPIERTANLVFFWGNLRGFHRRKFIWFWWFHCGCGLKYCVGSSIAHGQWSAYEIQQSSTWRELKAVDQVLRSFASVLAGHTIKWFTDNQNVVHIVRVGRRCPDGTHLALFIQAWTMKSFVPQLVIPGLAGH